MSTFLLWLFLFLICSLNIKYFLKIGNVFSVFHLSNLVYDVFAKKKLSIYYAVKFIHFSPVIFFSSKNTVCKYLNIELAQAFMEMFTKDILFLWINFLLKIIS